MTREEAREILTHNWTRADNPNYSESELDEAFFMAIEALSEDKVLCRDCKWLDTRPNVNDCHNPRFGDGNGYYSPPYVEENGFCSWAERREP